MNLVRYSACRIQFRPKNRSETGTVQYDRALIELHKYDADDYLLQGIDINQGKKDIFSILLTENGLYKFGFSCNIRDEICSEDGTYYVWLSSDSRDEFHAVLREVLAKLTIPNKKSLDIIPERGRTNKRTKIDDQDNILIDIHKLSEYIENGNVDEAKDLALKLASKHVQLRTKTMNRELNDEKLRIRVTIDGIDSSSSGTDEPCVLNVYSSTTIKELRALFQYTHRFPSENQYFFVNGHLAYAESTMKDLQVEKNPLFILFLTSNSQNESSRV